MKIKINLKIFIFLLIFILTRQIKIYGILMLFAFIHEIGHLIAGMMLGLKMQSLSITPIGFSLEFEAKIEDCNKKIKKANILALKKIVIAIAGPFMNLCIIIISYLYCYFSKCSNFIGMPINIVIYSNILIFLFNFIPIFPLDGGRILKEIIHIFYGLRKSYIYINKISFITLIVLTIISSIALLTYHNIAILLVLIYLWIIFIKFH